MNDETMGNAAVVALDAGTGECVVLWHPRGDLVQPHADPVPRGYRVMATRRPDESGGCCLWLELPEYWSRWLAHPARDTDTVARIGGVRGVATREWGAGVCLWPFI